MTVEALGTSVGVPPEPAQRRNGLPARLAGFAIERKGAALGFILLTAIIAVAVFAPLVAPYDPNLTNWTAVRKPPSALHLLGTDETGRDVLSRVIYGARASLLAGLTSVFLAMAAGIPLGLIAGMRGGWLDVLISRVTDALLACPFLILAIALAAFLGPSLTNAMIAIGVTTAPVMVLLTRAQVLGIKAEDYIEAARAIGASASRIAVFHVLPNALPALMVQAALSLARAIISEASLSFLGLGQQPPEPSWGSMLYTAQRYLTNAPWMAIWPGLAIFVTVFSVNLLGDGLRDGLNPRER
jgi:peptide/nickel transport system permease protein